MSERTPCNYCTLRWLEADAKKSGQKITRRPGGIGVNLFRHYPATLIPLTATMDHPNFVASMMEMGHRCEC